MYLIKVGIENGLRKALGFAFGILLSDLVLLALIFFGFSSFLTHPQFKLWFSLISGLLIVVFGLVFFFKKVPTAQLREIDIKGGQLLLYIAKGFGINFLNPFTIAVWVGILGSVSPTSRQEFVSFALGVLGVIFLADTLKAYGAKKIGALLNEKTIRRLNRAMGLIFTAIGIYFLAYSWQLR
jgi:threonine/homoserine/homoserine lactone efflux protein